MAIQKITASVLGNNAVTAANVAAGALSAADIADNSLTAAKLSTSTFAIDSLTVNTSDLVVDTANNRVGIGTPSPSRNLTVKASSSQEGIELIDADYSLFLIQKSGTSANTSYVSMMSEGNTTVRLHADNVSYFNGGNVGIGETSPDYKLHISGSGSAAQMQIESTSNTNAQLIFRNTASAGSGVTGGFHIGLLGDTSGDGLIYHHHDKPIRFYTNAANTMTLTGENGMLHLNGRSGAYGYAVPQDEALGYTNNLNAGAFGILHRGSYDSYVTGNAYYYKTGGATSWRAKYGAYKSTVMGMVNGAFTFDCSSTAPGSNGAVVSGLAARVRIDSDGLKFGSDTAAANALDDYEEGTWTPTYSGNTGLSTVSGITSASGKYIKIGNLVHLQGQFTLNGSSGTTIGEGDSIRITGLPYYDGSANMQSPGNVYTSRAFTNLGGFNGICYYYANAYFVIQFLGQGNASWSGDENQQVNFEITFIDD